MKLAEALILRADCQKKKRKSRVRFPPGLPQASIAQRSRAALFESEGSRFKS